MPNIVPIECVCGERFDSAPTSSGVGSATATVAGSIKAAAIAVSDISVSPTLFDSVESQVIGTATLTPRISAAKLKSDAATLSQALFTAKLSSGFSLNSPMVGQSIVSPVSDKFNGVLGSLACSQKLYPTDDVTSGVFKDQSGSNIDLFDSIDEGVFSNSLYLNGEEGTLIADDGSSYIQPSAIFTSGSFEYQCVISKPLYTFAESHIRLRMSGPTSTNDSVTPPQYTVKDIQVHDPSGNLITQYSDITFRGDGTDSYATYSSSTVINNSSKRSWEDGYPLLDASGDFTLSFTVDAISTGGPFTEGFDEGFEELNPKDLPAGYDDPNDSIRISAIEICNSGLRGPAEEHYLALYTEVQPTGHRIERSILPREIRSNTFDNGLYPVASSVWSANGDLAYSNITASGQSKIVEYIRNDRTDQYAELSSTGPIADSGKLILEFGLQGIDSQRERTPGAFNFGFDAGSDICEPTGAFDTIRKYNQNLFDTFFADISSVTLKVTAKKASGTRDYALDVVGYSDDGLLNVTPIIGGFLQNVSGDGTIPLASGFVPSGISIGQDAISAAQSYYETSGTNNAGGDHYLLPANIVNTTDFADYEVPLRIYPDDVALGVSREYSLSSMFEQIILDIFPLPTGAAISKAELVVTYAPQNALKLVTQGGENVRTITSDRPEASVIPIARTSGDPVWNSGPSSVISDPIHGYSTPNSSKINYARRWKGVDGVVVSPFDVDEFGFGFAAEQIESPFTLGHFDFSSISGGFVLSQSMGGLSTVSGDYGTNASPLDTVGWRFQDQTVSTGNDYASLDWSGSGVDSFGYAIDPTDNINFGTSDFASGYAVYLKFSPTNNADGLHTLVSRASDFDLKYNYSTDTIFFDGHSSSPSVGISQALSDPIYPLQVIATYNDDNSDAIRLYVKDETNREAVIVSSGTVNRTNVASDLILNANSDAYFHEFGIAGYNAGGSPVVSGDIDATYRQQKAVSYLNSRSMHWGSGADSVSLAAYIDDGVSGWHLGAYNYRAFSFEFDRWTQRVGRDYINFHLNGDGVPYINKTDKALPSNIDSGVSYHTQMENDYLRFALSDTASNFYSTARRVTKNLPRNYIFEEEAICVDTILEHSGDVSPTLVVSLYSGDELVTRQNHVLPASGNVSKLTTVFNYDTFLDQSEAWSTFEQDVPAQSEFKEKYFASDVDEMFLQYDLVYPSSAPFSSNLDIHTANVRLENALVSTTDLNGSMSLTASGNPSPVSGQLSLYTVNTSGVDGQTLDLNILGPVQLESLTLDMSVSGQFIGTENLDLFIDGYVSLNDSLDIYTSGSPAIPVVSDSGVLGLVLLAKDSVSTSGNGILGLPLTAYNTETATGVSENLPLNIYSTTENAVQAALPLYSYVDPAYDLTSDSQSGRSSGVMNLFTTASSQLLNRFPSASMPLFIYDNKPNASLNLVLYNERTASSTSGDLSLFIANYNVAGTGETLLEWNNRNYGSGIDVEDNVYASIPASSEIRGVDLIGYGTCDGDSPSKAVDPAIITHGTTWRPETCVDGGISRAKDTFTDLDAGFSGNYYGIRKYTGLVPNAAYDVEMKVQTGSTETIDTPPELEEWGYGTTSEVDYSGIKITEGDNRASGNRFGYSVDVKGDLLTVGTPNVSIYDESGVLLDNAGSVYVYRRGADIPGEKAEFTLEDQVTLPSGFVGNYSTTLNTPIVQYDGIGSINAQQWNVGQEGREFGKSVAVAASGGREVIVAGAPNAGFSETFTEISTSGVPTAMLLFLDIFEYEGAASVTNKVREYDILYKYFAAPIGGVQPQLETKLLVFQAVDSSGERPVQPEFTQDWITHTYINKLNDFNFINVSGQQALRNSVSSGVQEAFLKAFPYDSGRIHNNIPPIVGIFQDNSASLNIAKGTTVATDGAVEDFIDFYNDYAYQSGVISLADQTAQSGYVNRTAGEAETWEVESVELLDETLATGNLITENALNYITSGIGLEWAQPNAFEFQITPASGGRVYVFEKEDTGWQAIQEIKSADEIIGDSNNLGSAGLPYKNYFGHDVAISEDTNVISVGSPFASDPCNVYERSDSEETRLFAALSDWKDSKGLSPLLGYNDLTPGQKFEFRTDRGFWSTRGGVPQVYKKAFGYSYSNIPYVGTYKFLVDEFAGTSRLGYSTDLTSDGSTVVFGAPTDSFNEFDDTNVWGKGLNTWASYINAGAVRVFDSRKYYPHTKTVEYGRFGNLDRNSNIVNSGDYEYMDEVYSDFRRMPFSELDIPEDAGLCYIITPEVDATSDEIIQNIKDWLILGDRTLVLVGNDPIYEGGGRYARSNQIINSILSKLGSRMKIEGARNSAEAWSNGTVVDRYNVTKSKVPVGAHGTSISSPTMYASGVGDIRINLTDRPSLYIESPCDDLNYRCNLPIQNGGDLRAEWNAECTGPFGFPISYNVNWPFHFGNNTGGERCEEPPRGIINRPNEDPRPILTMGEYIPPSSYTIPATSGYVDQGCTTYTKTITKTSTETRYSYADTQVDSVAFAVSGVNDIDVSGVNLSSFYLTSGVFDDYSNPSGYNNRDAFLQGEGQSFFLPPLTLTRELSPTSNMVTQETVGTSEVVLVASVYAESAEAMIGTDPQQTDLEDINNDENVVFFENLVRRLDDSCNGDTNIVQLGGWTGRTSFDNAYSGSRLATTLNNISQTNTLFLGKPAINLQENFTGSLSNTVHTLWIANANAYPSDADIAAIQAWLDLGQKKLIVTYDENISSAQIARYICTQLNLNSKPFLQTNGQLFKQDGDVVLEGNAGNSQQLDSTSSIVDSCGLDFSQLVIAGDRVTIEDTNNDSEEYSNGYPFIPISGGDNTNSVIFYNSPVSENYEVSRTAWEIKGKSEFSFPVEAGSGYRVYYTWVSENESETVAPQLSMKGVRRSAWPASGNQSIAYVDPTGNLNATTIGVPQTAYVDVRATSDADSITFTFQTNYRTEADAVKPFTTRLLSVSGCPLAVTETTTVLAQDISVLDPDISPNPVCSGYWKPIPEQVIVVPEQFRSVQTDNTKYCGETGCDDKGGQLIEDGPVVAAEEIESFSSFPNGVQRSRIVLLADSSMVQGVSEYLSAGSPNRTFMSSLYPDSPSNTITLQNQGGREYEFVQKIVAPERGSAGKYYVASGLPLLISRYGYGSSSASVSEYVDNESGYDPRDVSRPTDPKFPEQIRSEIQAFGSIVSSYGTYPRYSGVIDGEIYTDANVGGGVPSLLNDFGFDYLDIDESGSGFAGDLFGKGVAIDGTNLIIGAPFQGFSQSGIISWSGVAESIDANLVESGIALGREGGAGAAFIYQQTGSGTNAQFTTLPWEFQTKLRPAEIYVGSGSNNHIGDQFGHSVAISRDVVAVTAPGHDWNWVDQRLYNSGEFVRKDFNAEFDIMEYEYFDMANSGVRSEIGSGVYTPNMGAVFTFQHKLNDWSSRGKAWTNVQKLTADGYGSPSGQDQFGYSSALFRSNRGDSSYTLCAASPSVSSPSGLAVSGDVFASGGGAWIFDNVLRGQVGSVPNAGSNINAAVFGNEREADLTLDVSQNVTGDSIVYTASGMLFSNSDGEIFLEVSGYDPSPTGFIAHRPFVKSVTGNLKEGTASTGILPLSITGKPFTVSGCVPLTIVGPETANVYNSMDLFTSAWNTASGTPFLLNVSGVQINSGSGMLNLIVPSGLDSVNNSANPLPLRIRGK